MLNKLRVSALSGLICVIAVSLQAQTTSPNTTLSWAQSVKWVIESNPEVRQAKLSLEIAQERVHLAEKTYFPNLAAVIAVSQDLAQGQGSQLSQTLRLTQTKFANLDGQPDIELASAGLLREQSDVVTTLSGIRYKLATALIELWNAQQLAQLNETIVTRRRKNLDLVTAGFESGREHLGSKQWADAQANSAKNELLQAQRQVRLSALALHQILGPNSPLSPRIGLLDATLREMPPAPTFLTLHLSHPQLLSAKATILEKTAAFHSAVLTNSASLSAGITSDQFGSLIGTQSGGNSIDLRVQLSVPLFSNGVEQSARVIAETDLRAAEASYESIHRQVELQVNQAWIELLNARDSYNAQLHFRTAAQTRSEIANLQYASGLLTYENWDLIENEVVNQERLVLSRQKALLIAIAAWHKAIGKDL